MHLLLQDLSLAQTNFKQMLICNTNCKASPYIESNERVTEAEKDFVLLEINVTPRKKI